MKEFFRNLKLVWQYSKDQKWNLIVFLFCGIINIIIGVLIPIISSKVIVNMSNGILEQLIGISIVLFLTYNIGEIIWYKISISSQKIFRETNAKLQTEIGKEILRLENKVLEKKVLVYSCKD